MSQNRARERNRDMERHERRTHTNAERQRDKERMEKVVRETQRKGAGKRAGRALRIRGRGAGANKDGVPPSDSPLAGVQSSGLTGNPVGSKLRLLKPQGQRRVESENMSCYSKGFRSPASLILRKTL